MKLPFQSIRWRIQAWHGLILLVAIGAFCITTYQLVWFNQLRRIDKQIHQLEQSMVRGMLHQHRQARDAAASQEQPTGETGEKRFRPLLPEELLVQLKAGAIQLPDDLKETFSGTDSGHFFFSIADAQGTILLQSENAPASLDFLPLPLTGDANQEGRGNGKYREIARSTDFGLCTIVGRDLTLERSEMRWFALSLGASGGALWIFGLLGGWWFAGRAIQPIQSISKTATRIAEGNLKERIDTDDGTSELDQLSHVLNHTFDRLNAALEQQRQFTADASHELRTPLTILLSETQRMRKPGRKREISEYQESFDLCHDACVRMRHLVESLLLLARQDRGAVAQNITDCNLAELSRDSMQLLKPLADAKSIVLEDNLEDSLVRADRDMLMVVLNNLIGNAIQHHDGSGLVTVRCGLKNGCVQFQVEDDGPGINEEDLPRIFDRFYRADKSRNNQESHSGLGLALAKTIVENMNGRISVQSKPGQGTVFTVYLPGTWGHRTSCPLEFGKIRRYQ